jgi:hypothetical protein
MRQICNNIDIDIKIFKVVRDAVVKGIFVQINKAGVLLGISTFLMQ